MNRESTDGDERAGAIVVLENDGSRTTEELDSLSFVKNAFCRRLVSFLSLLFGRRHGRRPRPLTLFSFEERENRQERESKDEEDMQEQFGIWEIVRTCGSRVQMCPI